MNTESLARWLDVQGIAAGEPVETSRIPGGASNEIYEIRRGGRRMVLRTPPPGSSPRQQDATEREYRVLQALNGTDVPHPEAIGACADPGVIGSPFCLMELVDGWSPMNSGGWPEPFRSDPSLRPGLAYQLVEGIARLGNVDWRAQGLEGFGRPEGFHERQVDRWLAHLATFGFREIPGLDVAAAWLRRHRPSHWEPGIMHGDYQFANVMFRHGAPARLAALVDFEMATIGDPLLDLAWVVMSWPDASEDRTAQWYVDFTGMPDRADLLEHYAKLSGRDVGEIDYYVILARFKMAIVLEGGHAQFVKGEASNPAMAYFGDIVLQMASQAAELAAATRL